MGPLRAQSVTVTYVHHCPHVALLTAKRPGHLSLLSEKPSTTPLAVSPIAEPVLIFRLSLALWHVFSDRQRGVYKECSNYDPGRFIWEPRSKYGRSNGECFFFYVFGFASVIYWILSEKRMLDPFILHLIQVKWSNFSRIGGVTRIFGGKGI